MSLLKIIGQVIIATTGDTTNLHVDRIMSGSIIELLSSKLLLLIKRKI